MLRMVPLPHVAALVGEDGTAGAAPRERAVLSACALILPRAVQRSGGGGPREAWGRGQQAAYGRRTLTRPTRSVGYGEAPAMAKRRLWRSAGYGEASAMAKRGGGGGHCERERSNPGFAFIDTMDCFVAALLAMTPRFVCSRKCPLHHAAHGPPPPPRCARGGGRNGGAAPRERAVLSACALILPRAVQRSGGGGPREAWGRGQQAASGRRTFNDADAKRRLWRSAVEGAVIASASKAIQGSRVIDTMDGFVAALLAMTPRFVCS